MQLCKILSVRLRRRAMAISVFRNAQLEFSNLLHLPASLTQARSTTHGYLSWAVAHFHPELLVLESVSGPGKKRVSILARTVTSAADTLGLPSRCFLKSEVIRSFALPEPTTRRQLRAVAANIWPALAAKDHDPMEMEAAALGLYAQCLTILNQEQS